MRVAGGAYKGRVLAVPKGMDVRPTSDKVRQAVFNSLLQYGMPEGAYVLDIFCGTGALGIEALSRGAEFCLFWDKSPESLSCCRENINALGLSPRASLSQKDSEKPGDRPPATIPSTLVFIDPPYRKGLILPALRAALKGGWLAHDALCVIEAEKEADIFLPDDMGLLRRKVYGDTQVLICRCGAGARNADFVEGFPRSS